MARLYAKNRSERIHLALKLCFVFRLHCASLLTFSRISRGLLDSMKTLSGGLTETASGLLQTNSVRRSYSLSNNIFLCKLNFHCRLLSSAFASYITQFHAAFTAALRFRSASRFVLPSRSDSFRLATPYPACKCFTNLFLEMPPPIQWRTRVFNVLQPETIFVFFLIRE